MSLTTPERRAEMVREWRAQRLMLVKYRNKIAEDIRCLDEMIETFGEVSSGPSR